MTLAVAAATVVAVIATLLADLRWLRVAQREHYLTGSTTRFALRWWGLGPSRLLAAAAVLGVVLTPLSSFTTLVGALAIAIGPFRYPLRGRGVVWTLRLRSVAATVAGAQALMIVGGVLLGVAAEVSGLVALTAPLAIDAALFALQPVEDRRAQRFVDQARARLEQVRPTIVAITGSYGKTSTKVYAAHLMSGAHVVVATPASFNNRAGLSTAINEHLTPGTNVFIAEMGTYGKGEIAAMCAWCPPRVAAITAIGPVHLERFGDESVIVAAKSEILDRADTVVLNADDPRLAALADAQESMGRTVLRCSIAKTHADVCVQPAGGQLVVTVRGEQLAVVDTGPSPGNVAVAVALALAVDTPPAMIATALTTLPSVANRRAQVPLSTGATAVDDTFNSNPAGADAALGALGGLARAGHRRVVVTPGMVELGTRQADANEAFATAAACAATELILVGLTNRAALVRGATSVPAEERAQVLFADVHEDAVEWVKAHTGPGDVVLYEGQLPDHYP